MSNPSEVATLIKQARMQPAAFAEIYHLYDRRVYGYITYTVVNVEFPANLFNSHAPPPQEFSLIILIPNNKGSP